MNLLLLVGASLIDIEAQYASLKPTSLSEHLAFYALYKDTPFGKKALRDACRLVFGKDLEVVFPFPSDIETLIGAMGAKSSEQKLNFSLSKEAKEMIEQAAGKLANRQLKGHFATSEEEILALPDNEIDISHAVFLVLMPEDKEKIYTFEALLDLMALEIVAKCPKEATMEEKQDAINQLVFYDMGFRFPPMSVSEKFLERYSALPSILESRRGVCLGVATLLHSLADRLGVTLDSYTPPGHIFVGTKSRNIEPTARGIHRDFEEYESITTKKLKKRTRKEVVGLVLMNAAAEALSSKDYKSASKYYERCAAYMKDYQMFHQLYGATLLLLQDKARAKEHFQKACSIQDEQEISSPIIAEDLQKEEGCSECLSAIFLRSDETRKSKEEKEKAIIQALKKHPHFRAGLLEVASLSLELEKPKEAIVWLEKALKVNDSDLEAHFLLTLLYHERYDDIHAFEHFAKALEIAKQHGLDERKLKKLEAELVLTR
jgi:tetratricopeptide (TPR) repeat protein